MNNFSFYHKSNPSVIYVAEMVDDKYKIMRNGKLFTTCTVEEGDNLVDVGEWVVV
jgi:hypothetical protein